MGQRVIVGMACQWYVLADASLTSDDSLALASSHELRTQHRDPDHRRQDQGGHACLGDETAGGEEWACTVLQEARLCDLAMTPA